MIVHIHDGEDMDELRAGRRYRYKVCAVAEQGRGPWSAPSNTVRIPTKLEFIVIDHERKLKKAQEASASESGVSED